MTDKRQFILDTLLPYKLDPSKCGYDKENKLCVYLAPNGNTCAAGQHMKGGPWQKNLGSILIIFDNYGKEKVLTPEAFDMKLNDSVWEAMQDYHDCIATNESKLKINSRVDKLEEITGFNFVELMFEI